MLPLYEGAGVLHRNNNNKKTPIVEKHFLVEQKQVILSRNGRKKHVYRLLLPVSNL